MKKIVFNVVLFWNIDWSHNQSEVLLREEIIATNISVEVLLIQSFYRGEWDVYKIFWREAKKRALSTLLSKDLAFVENKL